MLLFPEYLLPERPVSRSSKLMNCKKVQELPSVTGWWTRKSLLELCVITSIGTLCDYNNNGVASNCERSITLMLNWNHIQRFNKTILYRAKPPKLAPILDDPAVADCANRNPSAFQNSCTVLAYTYQLYWTSSPLRYPPLDQLAGPGASWNHNLIKKLNENLFHPDGCLWKAWQHYWRKNSNIHRRIYPTSCTGIITRKLNVVPPLRRACASFQLVCAYMERSMHCMPQPYILLLSWIRDNNNSVPYYFYCSSRIGCEVGIRHFSEYQPGE